MKALSIHPFYVDQILSGEKTIEYRTWFTHYRGDLLICATAKKKKGTISGHALCVVTLEDIQQGLYNYEWILSDIRYIKPIPLKGKLNLWNYDGEIEYLPGISYKDYMETFKELIT